MACLSALCLLATLDGGEARAQVAGKIVVYPTTSTVEYTSTKQFSAYVPISPNTIVWLVNDVLGGNATLGTITATGLYKPPVVIPANNVVTIKARSTAYPSSFGTASLTITKKVPAIWSVSPASLVVGPYAVGLNGNNFAPDSQVLANGVAVQSTYVSPTKLTAKGTAAAVGTLQFAVRQPAPGAVTSNSVAVPVTASVTTVAVAPATANVQVGTSRGFTATVMGNANTAVTWAVNGVAGGSAAIGTISTAGLYTAPAIVPSPASVTIRATSVASPSSFAQASVTVIPPVTVVVAPATATVLLGGAQAFAATVTGHANTGVTWAVNGVTGGSATVGTISAAGLYTGPAVMPVSNAVTVRATSVVSASAMAQSTVMLIPPVSVTVAPGAATVAVQGTQAFTATVTGSANTAVTWAVNGVVGGSSAGGTISPAGVYTAPVAVPAPSTVTVKATSVASPASVSQVIVTVTAPPPPAASLTAARFLAQSSFGPNPAALAQLQQMGIDAYLDLQFSAPETVIPVPADNSMGTLRQRMLHNYSTAPDQLRQRVAFALSQILVTSGNKLIYPDENIPWLRLLSQHAFGNYRDLLRDITKSPSMGKYLDLANSRKPGLAGGANENYPRELMQLFSVGLWNLNQDGSQLLVGGSPVPTYTQQDVAQLALALTGWTYATVPGAAPQSMNWEYFGAPMETRQANHDMSAKTFLGCSVPAGQAVEADLESVLDCLMAHPNTAPFMATRLIRLLVMSNPSPDYIQRVAAVFAGAGGGVPGDLKAVIKAILTDTEARQDTATVTQGRLKDPILQVVGFLRALNGGFTSTHQLSYLFDYLGQSVLTPPSVFSWFSPLYRVPGKPLFGPEFQIYSPASATLVGNFLHHLLSNPGSDAVVDLSPFQAYGNDMPNLVEAVNQVLLFGRMPAPMKQALIEAAAPGYDAKTRIETVLYLTALSGQYAVQH
ncbi:MAG: DUF1800 family protein [Vicinamibacterales bacterium]